MKRESWLWANRWTILVVVVLLLLVTQVSQMDYNSEQAELEQYCEMVKLFLQTRGDSGWPDFKGIYNSECR